MRPGLALGAVVLVLGLAACGDGDAGSPQLVQSNDQLQDRSACSSVLAVPVIEVRSAVGLRLIEQLGADRVNRSYGLVKRDASKLIAFCRTHAGQTLNQASQHVVTVSNG